jgi:hypothetical protein
MFQLEFHEIYICFSAEKAELRPDLELFDPNDVGIFANTQDDISKLKLLLKISKLKLT